MKEENRVFSTNKNWAQTLTCLALPLKIPPSEHQLSFHNTENKYLE